MATNLERGTAPVGPERRTIDLGVVTPWPPDRSGIADYVRDLAVGLVAAGDQVTVYTAVADPILDPDVPIRPLGDVAGAGEEHDVLVYHIGNHARFHLAMLQLLEQTGGLVHLHDLVLHHLVVGYHETGQRDRYLAAVERWHGAQRREEATAAIAAGAPLWESRLVSEVPLLEEVLQHADGVLVHSKHARQQVTDRLPHLAVEVVPQRYADGTTRCLRSERDDFEILLAGSLEPNRQPGLVLDAVIDLDRPDVTLRIVGEVAASVQPLVDRAAVILGARLVQEGFVSEERLVRAIADADLVVSLRRPTMGETSAVCVRALELGTPLLVTDVGWYAELPGAVRKVPEDEGADAVRAILASFVADDVVRAGWQAAAAQAAAELPTFAEAVEVHRHALRSLQEVCSEPGAERSWTRPVVRHFDVGDGGLVLAGIEGVEPRVGGAVAELGTGESVLLSFDLAAAPGGLLWVAAEFDASNGAPFDVEGLEVRLDGQRARLRSHGRRLVAHARLPNRTTGVGDRHLLELRRVGGIGLPPLRAVRAAAVGPGVADPSDQARRRRLAALLVGRGESKVPLLDHDVLVLGAAPELARRLARLLARRHDNATPALVGEGEGSIETLVGIGADDAAVGTPLLVDIAEELAAGDRPALALVVVVDPLRAACDAAERWATDAIERGRAPDADALRARTLRELRWRLNRPHPLESVAPELLLEPGPVASGWRHHRRGSLEVLVLDGHRPDCWTEALTQGLGVKAPGLADATAPGTSDASSELALPREALDSAYDREQRVTQATLWCSGPTAVEERHRAAISAHAPPPSAVEVDATAELDELRYLERLHDWENGADRGPLAGKEVLVYALPKTGTVTLYHSIGRALTAERGWFDAKFHCLHNHHNRLLQQHTSCLDGTVPVSLGGRCVADDIVRYRSLVGRSTLVAASYREPVARAISHVFHELDQRLAAEGPDLLTELGGEGLLRMLAVRLRHHANVPSPIEELVPTFYDDFEMDHDLGACIVDLDACRVLALPLERSDQWPTAIGAALDRGPVELVTQNQAADKPIAGIYQTFTQRLVVPSSVIDELHDGDTRSARYVHWYYDAPGREALRAQLLDRYGPRPGADLVLDPDLLRR